jgi:ketosteroid isomerase-like protein
MSERASSPDTDTLEANKQVALAYVDAFNEGDLDAIGSLLADDFVWRTAITGEGEAEVRPFQSKEFVGRPSPFVPVRQRQDTLEMLAPLFASDDSNRFRLRVVSVTAEDDRVAVEMEGDARNPLNGRSYGNIYFILMRVRDGKLHHYTEYQDTLHVFDVWVAD